MKSSEAIVNALTVDVEDYFQVQAFVDVVSPHQWESFESRVEDNTYRVLDLFAKHGLKATFFVLGWEAKRRPAMLRRIIGEGHELACHGYGHQLIYQVGPDAFRADVRRAKDLLEDISGQPVNGYRAPSYSITSKSLWALAILVEEGFLYDSSVVPIRHDTYGLPGAPRFPYRVVCSHGSLIEFPPSTMQVGAGPFRVTVPVGGGGYLRLYPFSLTKWGLNRINNAEGQAFSVYVHPWELDPYQPRVAAPAKSRFRHYTNLHQTANRLVSLLEMFIFATMGECVGVLQDLPTRHLFQGTLRGTAWQE